MAGEELLHRPQLKGPIKTSTGVWANRTVVGSGVASVVVSANPVNSDSIILLSIDSQNTVQSSGIAQPMEVSSIVSNTSFTIGWADGNSLADRETIVMWMLIQGS